MATDIHRVRVGVGVLVRNGNQVLLGKRKGSHGAGEWAFPGGHLEYLEGFTECAKREVREETGLEITNIRFLFLANVDAYKPKHYVHIHLTADVSGGTLELKEPEKCEGWEWFDLDQIPEPRFTFVNLTIESLKTGRTFFDLE
ncbi:MAG: NUDIX domain-containing protein [Candidatus Kerfeldbacteria bacterium]|nr:NUDIX domain-containing protein [Candidatus Kerfeldbacteria bacterium]